MLEHTFVRPCVIARLRRGPLGLYLDDLATSLHQRGPCPDSIQRSLVPLSSLPNGCKDKAMPSLRSMKTFVQRDVFRAHARPFRQAPESGPGPPSSRQIPPPTRRGQPTAIHVPTPPLEQWLAEYNAHLEQVAGLALSTRQGYRRIVRRFIVACFGAEAPDGRRSPRR